MQTEVIVTRGHQVQHRIWTRGRPKVIVLDGRRARAWYLKMWPHGILRRFGLFLIEDAAPAIWPKYNRSRHQ